MPNPKAKRRNPSPENEVKVDGKKKARTDSDTANDGGEAGVAVKLAVAINASGSPIPCHDNNKPLNTPSISSSFLSSSTEKNAGSSEGSNAFLTSLRLPSRTANGETKKPPTANTSAPAPMDMGPVGDSNTPQNGAAPTSNGTSTPTTKGPVVPLPHLPLDYESRRKTWLQPVVVLLLFLLDTAAVIYIAHQKNTHSLIQLENNLELKRLHDDLASSQTEVNIKRERMSALEQAREARKAMRAKDAEVFPGLSDANVGGGDGELLTDEERREWFEKFSLLEVEGQSALDEFNKKLSQF